jgi:hypothetical protein
LVQQVHKPTPDDDVPPDDRLRGVGGAPDVDSVGSVRDIRERT